MKSHDSLDATLPEVSTNQWGGLLALLLAAELTLAWIVSLSF